MEMKRKRRSYRGAVGDRAGDETRAAGLEVVAQEKSKKRKSPRLERRMDSVERVGEDAVALSEDVENKKETRKRKEKAEDLEDVTAPSGEGGTAAVERRHTSKQPMRSGSSEKRYDPKKVWVRGLPPDITDDGIRSYFARCGEISEMYCQGMVLHRKNFKRCLIFAAETGATKSLECDGSDIGCSLRVWRFLTPQANKQDLGWVNVPKIPGLLMAKIGDLPMDVDEESIRAFLKKSYSATKIECVKLMYDCRTGMFTRKAFVKFGDDESVDAAVKLNQTHLLGKPVKVAYSARAYETLKLWSGPQNPLKRFGRCYICGKDGHISRICPEKKIYPCVGCGEDGHRFIICPEKGFYWRALRLAASQSVQPVHTYFCP